jgi:hypothetical protein
MHMQQRLHTPTLDLQSGAGKRRQGVQPRARNSQIKRGVRYILARYSGR